MSHPDTFDLLLRGEWALVDPKLPEFLEVLTKAGARVCWHKHGVFFDHLFDVYKILKIWGMPDPIARCGLFHSAYSNSYVNLALFDIKEGREKLQGLIGHEAEALVHMFCSISRNDVVFKTLLPAGKVLAEGVHVQDIRGGPDIFLDQRTLGVILVLTIADFQDQLFSWQDRIFEHGDGKLQWKGNNPGSLWPGETKPGLWMSAMSRMASLARTTGAPLPPIFEGCTVIVDEVKERTARDLYWQVVMTKTEPADHAEAAKDLLAAIATNPFLAEPHVLLAQIYCIQEHWEEARSHAEQALRLWRQWATNWDKRTPFEG